MVSRSLATLLGNTFNTTGSRTMPSEGNRTVYSLSCCMIVFMSKYCRSSLILSS